MSIVKKIWQYIKDNKVYLIVMLIGSLAFIMQMKEVVLYADDFSLGIVSQGGFKEIIKYFQTNYMNWGGGLTCLFATTFLMFRIGVWKTFQCLIVIVTVCLATKMITYENKRNKALVASVIWLCFYILNIWISRETLYWLDGGLAYELTVFQIFIYFYYLYTRLHLKIIKKYDKILLPIVAFLAGWSSAQSGPLTAIIPLIIIAWEKIIKKEKISKFYYITTLIGVIGFAIFYFAPGNHSRMDTFAEYSNYNIVQKIAYRIESVYGLMFDFKRYQLTGIPFYLLLTLGLNAVIGLKLYSKEENKKLQLIVKIISAIQTLFIILCLGVALEIPYSEYIRKFIFQFENLLYAKNNGILTLKMFIPYVITTLVMLSMVIESFLMALKKSDPILPTIVISALIMQIIMVMAPYSPLRTTYYTIVFLWIAIAYLINIAYTDKINIAIIPIVLFTIYNTQLGIMAVIIYVLIKSINIHNLETENLKYEVVMVIGILLILAIGNYSDILINYKANKEIYNQNIARIQEYKKNEENGLKQEELYLLLPKNEQYGFTPMVGIEWVEDAIKQYFKLENVTLKAENVE